ncbi:hypothetical protein YPPY91_1680, partial [Yersinia pestis PY-91]
MHCAQYTAGRCRSC